jgi:ubiquinone/menaquinone biosynthesis C-methylase UbiE
MLNNLINISDFEDAWRRIKLNPKLQKKIANKIFSTNQEKVELAWSHTETAPDKWWFVPQIVKRWNYMITGNEEIHYTKYFVEKYLSAKNDYHGFSFACGTGAREIEWARTRKFILISGFDLSKQRIEKAKGVVVGEHLENILNFSIGDARTIRLKENYFDVYFGEQSVHHFSPLEKTFLRIKKYVKPDGLLLINEFVGPERFQWTDEQVKYSNQLLKSIPDSHKTYWQSSRRKTKVYKPGRLRMILNDPSEAIESSRILHLLDKHFERLELRNYGGTILHLVMDGIAHNFLNEDEETKSILKRCFDYEDDLINSGKLKSDFIFAVYRNNKTKTGS